MTKSFFNLVFIYLFVFTLFIQKKRAREAVEALGERGQHEDRLPLVKWTPHCSQDQH